jgi:hypothetical protein
MLIPSGWVHAQTVVSRRDYAAHGRTFTQIWMADAGTLNFRQLTDSAHDHSEPVCSPDGKRLVAGLYGENGGSGDPQNDYFLLDPATRTWTPGLTARRIRWLPGETLLYLRPFATTPLAPTRIACGPRSWRLTIWLRAKTGR